MRGTALITGGSQRIGAAIARDLAAHGFDVAIHCHSSVVEGEKLAREIVSAGGRAAVVKANLTEMAETGRLVAAAQDALGPVRLLVNNASVFTDDSVRNFDEALWEAHFAVHLKAPALLASKFADALPADQDGLIVNVIDQRVWALNPRFFSYTLSKSALWTATQTMAQALAPNIRVNAIGPGPTLRNARQRKADFQAQIDGLLLKRGPELAEFGATIRWLWETRSVTGQMVALDGGQHLAWETPDVAGIPE